MNDGRWFGSSFHHSSFIIRPEPGRRGQPTAACSAGLPSPQSRIPARFGTAPARVPEVRPPFTRRDRGSDWNGAGLSSGVAGPSQVLRHKTLIIKRGARRPCAQWREVRRVIRGCAVSSSRRDGSNGHLIRPYGTPSFAAATPTVEYVFSVRPATAARQRGAGSGGGRGGCCGWRDLAQSRGTRDGRHQWHRFGHVS